MNVLDLFSGIGGFSLGLERAGMSTVAFCETDDYCRRVLAKRWPKVPCHSDIRDLNGYAKGYIDLISGGFPCQPFSVAGKRRGAEDDRHLWPEMHRLIEECRPAWVLGENVAGLIRLGLDQVLSDLEGSGYACRTFAIPAVGVDAPHKRERLWIVAHAESRRGDGPLQPSERPTVSGTVGPSQAVAHGARLQPGRQEQRPERERTGPGGEQVAVDNPMPRRHGLPKGKIRTGWDGVERASRWLPEPDMGGLADGLPAGLAGCRWPDEPDIGRVAVGVPNRVQKLKALGNSVVPQVVEMIGHAIMQAEPA